MMSKERGIFLRERRESFSPASTSTGNPRSARVGSKQWLADMCDLSVKTIKNAEAGEAVSTDTLKIICEKLGQPDKSILPPTFKHSNLSNFNYVKDLHQVPTLEHFKMNPECESQKKCLFEGGETVALKLFTRRLELEKIAFQSNIVSPNKLKPIIFTEEISLSPYLRFGCLSPRKFYWDISKVFNKVSF